MQLSKNRNDIMKYHRCGASGFSLPVLSLDLCLNFEANADSESCRDIIFSAFDHGVTHIDVANDYGPPHGSAEMRLGEMLKRDLYPYNDELIISTKAGYRNTECGLAHMVNGRVRNT